MEIRERGLWEGFGGGRDSGEGLGKVWGSFGNIL